ncbi:E3 ubiquitin-protein ligase TRIM39-like [Hyperolius riggenbachi]|uniref:E3 ubiquitin-protein ligase TRIM39-like n=1 Tax=Hyperolius riggenbachi TaxID=752182 RepID=UPI0035A294E6
MAFSSLRIAFRCSICMDIYTDPVSLPCGHTFCRTCIIQALEKKWEQTGDYLCPECREDFPGEPHLLKNLPVNYIVTSLLQEDLKDILFPCSYCIDSRVPAVKSCMLCEAHLCDKHVEVHSKSPEHTLCDPTPSMESKRCKIHKRLLEYHCTEDNACVCVPCILGGEHQGHQVETLDEALRKKKIALRNVAQNLLVQKEETEKRVQGLQDCRRNVDVKASSEIKRVMDLFRNLAMQQKELEKRVLREVSRLLDRASRRCCDVIQKLETRGYEMSKKLCHIEELCNMTDTLAVLKESDLDNLYEEEDKQLYDGEHLDFSGISDMLHKGLSDILSRINSQEGLDIQASHSSEENYEPFGPFPQPQETFSAGQPSRQRIEDLPEAVAGNATILLDINTASNNLKLSEDRKTLFFSHKWQKRPETPERFKGPQVISFQSFSSGRHIWDVDVGRSNAWQVGMCYHTIDRRNLETSTTGHNNKSWTLQKSNNKFLAIHKSAAIRLPDMMPLHALRICLDYEAGQITIYNLTFPMRHIHTFHATFTEPLHAALSVCGGSIRLL